MAPSVISYTRTYDDFIPTISDDELDVPDLDEEQAEVNITTPTSNGLHKRKREADVANKERKRSRKGLSLRAAGDTIRLEEPATSGVDDGALDPDFEFDSGAMPSHTTSVIARWEVPTNHDRGTTDVPSIEDIIARRASHLKETTHMLGTPPVDWDVGNGLANAPGTIDHKSKDIGTEVVHSDELHMDVDGSRHENGGSRRRDDDEDDDDDDDDKSIAEPMAHPDDDILPLDDGEDDEEPEDAEVLKRRQAYFEDVDQANFNKPLELSASSFNTMSLSRPVLKGLAALNFKSPTPIQVKTIPVALLGKDIVGGAVTGSGKTAAFIIPILERLLYRSKVPKTRVGILMPTRELAVQCFNVATKLATFIPDISFALLVGGLSLREQEQTLKKRPDVVIATPGRFIDHMRNSASFEVESLEILVLDEADRMLEDGFADELNEILTSIPKSRQTMLFSATMTEDVDQLIRVGLSRPVRVMVDAKKKTVQGLVQEFIKIKGDNGDIDEDRRLAYLLHLCQNFYSTKVIVFLPRKSLAHRLKILFSLYNIRAAELHGSMSQEQRLSAMASFQRGDSTHLLATDLASRGLDIPRVETVINFSVPTTTTTYLHRVGRTARAGQSGVSCTLFSAANSRSSKNPAGSKFTERTLLRPILRLARSQAAEIRTRSLPSIKINELTQKIKSLDAEIDAILQDEKEERLLVQTERDLTKSVNLVKYETEIASRPRRTWFQNEKEKEASSKLGMAERKGMGTLSIKEKKKKMSGKQKKRLDNHNDRSGGKMQGWKKGKEERSGKGVLKREKEAKAQRRKRSRVGKKTDQANVKD